MEMVGVAATLFDFLWQYSKFPEDILKTKSEKFAAFYTDVVSEELLQELKHLKAFHSSNFGHQILKPLDLLNKITSLNLESVFSNISIALRILLTLPVTVASAERSFSKLKLIKNYLRSIMGQERLVNLAILGIESDLVKSIDFDCIINSFAAEKARRVVL